MATLSIRTAFPHDYQAAGELTATAYLDGGHISPDNDFYLPVLRDAARRARGAELLVAVEDDTVLGTLTLARHGDDLSELAGPGEVELRMLAVDPGAARRGVGRALVDAAIDRARRERYQRMVLCSQESMTNAHGLYESLGFVRQPDHDWYPVPEIRLLAFALPLT
jgi:ribosomal protein S18 acetylase RimI-like enzyme